jgi:hypothetical protein
VLKIRTYHPSNPKQLPLMKGIPMVTTSFWTKSVLAMFGATVVVLGGCASSRTQEPVQTIQSYVPVNPQERASIAEKDRDAWAQPILASAQQLHIWSIALSDDPRAVTDKSDPRSAYHNWQAEMLMVSLMVEYMSDVLNGLDRGETLSAQEFTALAEFARNLERSNAMRLVPRYGSNQREALLNLQGRSSTPGSRAAALQRQVPQNYSLAAAADSVNSLAMVVSMRAQNGASTLAPEYWRSFGQDLSLFGSFLGAQAGQMAARTSEGPAWSDVRTAHGLRIGYLSRFLLTRSYEFADREAMASLISDWTPDQHQLMRGSSVGDLLAAHYYFVWTFDITPDAQKVPPDAILLGVMPHWAIARELLPDALKGNGVPDLELRVARFRELQRETAQAQDATAQTTQDSGSQTQAAR